MTLQIRQGKIARALPIVVWLLAATAVGYLFVNQAQRSELLGIASSYEQSINIQESGYIKSLAVNLYQTVEQGQTLAVIKGNSPLQENLLISQRKTAEAELDMLRAELDAAAEELRSQQIDIANNMIETERQLSIEIEQARLEVLQMRSVLEPEKMQLKDLEVELEIVSYLIEHNAAEEYELKQIQSDYNVLKEKVNYDQELLAAAEDALKTATLRKDEFSQQKGFGSLITDKQLEPIRKAIVLQESRIAELYTTDTIVLTAPFDGIISALFFKPGQTVMAGAPIMTIVKPTSEYITAWIPQNEINSYEINTKVQVFSHRIPVQSFTSQIASIGASIEMMPETLWLNPTTPTWGLPVRIAVLPNFTCLHNEIVGIKKIY